MDAISESLGTATGIDRAKGYKDLIAKMEFAHGSVEDNVEKDYDFVRMNLHEILKEGMGAVAGIIQLAGEAQSPRMYESTSTFLKTLAEINESLLNISEKRIEVKTKTKKGDQPSNSIVNNNAFFCGSYEELNALISGREKTVESTSLAPNRDPLDDSNS